MDDFGRRRLAHAAYRASVADRRIRYWERRAKQRAGGNPPKRWRFPSRRFWWWLSLGLVMGWLGGLLALVTR